jgi:opacity protein-like surface antigen
MLSRVKIIMAVCISLLTSNAHAHRLNKKGPYIKAASGVVFYERLRKKSEGRVYEPKIGRTTAPIYLAFGYSPNKNIATEISARFSRFQYRYKASPTNTDDSTDSQIMDSFSLFWNLYLKYPITRRVVPYIVIGPGFAFNISRTMKIIPVSMPSWTVPGKSINSFAWNIGCGSEFHSTNKISLDVGYRYVSMGKIGVRGGHATPQESRKIHSHDITLGLAYKF